MRASAALTARGAEPPSGTSYVVLDDVDRIVHVGPDLADPFGRWVGHVLWDHLPDAQRVYGPCFAEARATGRAAESVVYYNGRVKRLLAIPAADGLAVHVERLGELDATSLGTLAQSLRRIEDELAARAPAPRDPRAHGSPQALP